MWQTFVIGNARGAAGVCAVRRAGSQAQLLKGPLSVRVGSSSRHRGRRRPALLRLSPPAGARAARWHQHQRL